MSVVILSLFMACSTKKEDKFMRSVKFTRPVLLGNVSNKNFSGVVKEAREIGLGFKTDGQIEKIFIKEGDFVKEGDVIAVLDKKDYQLGVDAYQIQYDQMKDEVARMEQLYKAKSISGNDYEKALAGLKQLEVQLKVNKNKLQYTTLIAPVSGYIQKVNYEKAEMLQAGSPIVNLLDVSKIKVEVDIPASLYMQRNNFLGFTCSSSLEPEDSYPLNLISINNKASSTQLYKMILSLPSAREARLTAGMNVVVNISIKASKETTEDYVLPISSIINADGKTYIWVLGKDSTVSRREVKLNGIDNTGKVIVTEGLNGEEQVVKAGVNSLQDKEKVRILPESDKTNVGGLF